MNLRRNRQHAQAVSWDRTGSEPLDRLLTAASAPTHADELAGLPDALTAFSLATPPPRSHPVMSTLAKLAAAKVLVGLAAGATVGGVALAAATGSLPSPVQKVAHDTVGAPAPDSGTKDATESPDATEIPEATETPDATKSASPKPSGSPSPNLIGLCRAYGAGVATSHGKALDSAAFTVLATTAGGKGGVAAYCTALLAANPTGKPSGHPTHSPQPHPTHSPQPHPTHTAAPHPTHTPVTHPTHP